MKTPAEYREMEFAPLLLELARLFKPKVYVEIGVKRGYTMKQMAQVVPGCIAIDIAPMPFDIHSVAKIQMPSLEYAKLLAKEKRGEFIDFLFIDGDHKAEAVAADFNAFLPFVRTGTGMIFLHDTHPIKKELLAPGYCNDAWRVAHAICFYRHEVEIVTLPGPWAGLSIMRKLGSHHLSWETSWNAEEGAAHEE